MVTASSPSKSTIDDMRSARYCESTIFRTGITFASRIGAHFERRFARHQHFWIAVEKLFHRSSLALKRAAVSDKTAARIRSNTNLPSMLCVERHRFGNQETKKLDEMQLNIAYVPSVAQAHCASWSA